MVKRYVCSIIFHSFNLLTTSLTQSFLMFSSLPSQKTGHELTTILEGRVTVGPGNKWGILQHKFSKHSLSHSKNLYLQLERDFLFVCLFVWNHSVTQHELMERDQGEEGGTQMETAWKNIKIWSKGHMVSWEELKQNSVFLLDTMRWGGH